MNFSVVGGSVAGNSWPYEAMADKEIKKATAAIEKKVVSVNFGVVIYLYS